MSLRRAGILSFALLAGGGAAVVPALGAGAPRAATDHQVTAVDFAFQPNMVTIAVGDSVTWSYPSGSSAHNVDFTDGPSFRMPAVPQPSGWTVTRTFDTPGTYHWQCDLHSYMTGTVVVTDSSSTTPTATTTTDTTPTNPYGSPPPTTSTATTTTPAAAPADTTAPRAGSVHAAKRRLRFVLSEAARLDATITRGHKRVATLHRRLRKGHASVALPRLHRGRYRITFRLTDAAGNRSKARSVSYVVR